MQIAVGQPPAVTLFVAAYSSLNVRSCAKICLKKYIHSRYNARASHNGLQESVNFSIQALKLMDGKPANRMTQPMTSLREKEHRPKRLELTRKASVPKG